MAESTDVLDAGTGDSPAESVSEYTTQTSDAAAKSAAKKKVATSALTWSDTGIHSKISLWTVDGRSYIEEA